MDQLYQRYADPFSFMNGMISTGRFEEFVVSVLQKINKEEEEETAWEFYLHKVFDDISFEDFLKSIKNNKQNQQMSEQTIEATVKDSMNILKNFNPV